MSFFTSVKHFNYVSKRNGTGFLTSGPETESNASEYKVTEAGIKEAVKLLSEKKIRSANIVERLEDLYDIQESVAMAMETSGKENKYEDSLDNWRAFAMIIVMTAVSSYSQHVTQKTAKKD
jgi:hypothetical protein